MTNTTFRNASGLPDPRQVTTARDMITLGSAPAGRLSEALPAVRDAHLHLRRQKLPQPQYAAAALRGTDGIKTGYTRASGFNLVSSVRRDGKHLVAAVFGGETARERNAKMQSVA